MKTDLWLMRACGVAVVFGCVAARGESVQALSDKQALKARDAARAEAYKNANSTGLKSSASAGRSAPKTSALPLDTDDDGMPDEWENANGLNAADPGDAWLDPDHDHAVNLFEYQLGASRTNSATPPVVTVGAFGAMYTNVEEAIDAAPMGAVIRVAGGTYLVNYVTFDEKRVMIQGGWNATFTARDLQATPTVLDGRLLDEVLYFSTSSGSPVIILDGLRVIRGHGTFGAVNLLAEETAWMRSSVVNCVLTQTIRDSDHTGVLNMISWGASSSDRSVVNTVIAGNLGCGIYATVTSNAVSHWRVINTTIAQNIDTNGTPLEALYVFTLDSGHLTGHIYNSILWAGSSTGQSASVRNWGNTIQFTVDHADCGTEELRGGATWVSGTGMLSVDPLFVAAGSGDFHLQASSTLIDKGLNTGVTALDADGRPRVAGGIVDLGAYEGSGLAAWDAGCQDIGGGWRRLSWFGDYAPMGGAGWIWHNKHGFLYVPASSTPQNVWMFTQDMGWLYTGNALYPFLFRANDAAWLWYNGSHNPRWFVNMGTGAWEHRP